MQPTCDWLPGKRGGEQGRGEIMCGVARKIIGVVGTERMLSNMGCIANGHIWYVRCTFHGVRTVSLWLSQGLLPHSADKMLFPP